MLRQLVFNKLAVTESGVDTWTTAAESRHEAAVNFIAQVAGIIVSIVVIDIVFLIQRKIVVLPEPDGPQTTTTSPFWMLVVQSVSTWKLPYHLETFLMSIMGGSSAAQRMIWIFFCSRRTSIDSEKQMTKYTTAATR